MAKLRLTIHTKNQKGDWIPQEIAGPTNFLEWQKGWRVFCVAMRGMDECDQARIDLYEMLVEELVQEFGDLCWWIIAQGEGRMRSERMPRLMNQELAAQEKAAKKGEVHELEVKRPWNWIFKVAANDDKFWQREVRDKCFRWITKTTSAEKIKDEGFGPVRPANSGFDLGGGGGGGGGGIKRKAPPQHDDSSSEGPAKVRKVMKAMKKKRGAKNAKAMPANAKADAAKAGRAAAKGGGTGKGGKHAVTAAGRQICFKYSRDNACAAVCPQNRAHVCEYCLQQHVNADCTA